MTELVKQTTFKSLLVRQQLIAVGLSLLLSIPIVLLFAYLYIVNVIDSDIELAKKVGNEAINTQLSSGWQTKNLDLITQIVTEQLPDSVVIFQKSPAYLEAGDTQIHPVSPHHALILSFIRQVEKNQQTIEHANFSKGEIYVALPIQFQKACIDCTFIPLGNNENYMGELAGTMLIQATTSIRNGYTVVVITFLVLFLGIFTAMVTYMLNLFAEDKILAPIAQLAQRVKNLKINSTERQVSWQRIPQEVIEVDQLDESITSHIDNIRTVYERLDSLMMTEVETGLYHQARFNEIMRYEVFRSYRYKHPFSLMVIKLLQVRVLNSTAKNIEEEEPGSKYLFFGNILNNGMRETDMSFRLDDQIFAVVAPETDEAGMKIVKDDIYRRLISIPLEEEAHKATALPEYEFTIQVGVSTYNCDDTKAKQVLKSAIRSMQQSEKQIGHYPPYKHKEVESTQ